MWCKNTGWYSGTEALYSQWWYLCVSALFSNTIKASLLMSWEWDAWWDAGNLQGHDADVKFPRAVRDKWSWAARTERLQPVFLPMSCCWYLNSFLQEICSDYRLRQPNRPDVAKVRVLWLHAWVDLSRPLCQSSHLSAFNNVLPELP